MAQLEKQLDAVGERRQMLSVWQDADSDHNDIMA